MGLLSKKDAFITTENIMAICKLNSNYNIWLTFEKETMQRAVENYLEQSSIIPSTFTLNQFKGTPTFILFDEEYCILEHWFGHKKNNKIKEILNRWV